VESKKPVSHFECERVEHHSPESLVRIFFDFDELGKSARRTLVTLPDVGVRGPDGEVVDFRQQHMRMGKLVYYTTAGRWVMLSWRYPTSHFLCYSEFRSRPGYVLAYFMPTQPPYDMNDPR
jgi:hypothetical protein